MQIFSFGGKPILIIIYKLGCIATTFQYISTITNTATYKAVGLKNGLVASFVIDHQ